ncbi:hypothetical protein DVA67_027075 [Solirubrobacter sp. CPCC 204708]|uniref:Uncharacterized protein n=1 Tax=Solirubrobacter deserti TaxID=2282478 RepID=A0ABT4RGG4_9ACTN|nr:hypothetical protein [Solirubrobacter deserti]MBE2319661.1 hypothetical protein [Solirubrobacter deserti]MDA0137600.1 hypothetical protein [Solirubrobacter deserti]
MPRQLADIMAEYAVHEESRKPTLFTRDDAGHVRAHEFNEPDDDSAIRRVQGIVADSSGAVTGLMLLAFEPERVLITATDGATHIAAQSLVTGGVLGEWRELTPGDPTATFMVNVLRTALGQDTLTQRKGALDEVAMLRRALDGFLQRVDANGHLATGDGVLEADRLGLVELARDALALAVSHGRADRQLDDGLTLRRVPSRPADLT